MKEKRTKRLHMLLSDQEWSMILAVADEHGLTVSDAIRQLIRNEYRRYGGRENESPAIVRAR